jgi:hypothetical protein|nr:MAG TPA: protein of unknown function (DUF5053) [Caudoviricetes sp.]
MNKTERFFELKELWKNSDEAHRAEIDKEISALLSSMNEGDDQELLDGVKKDFEHIHEDLEEVRQELLRDKMKEVLPAISVSYIARKYFGKSSSWFYQRLNGNKVNGKEAAFTPHELSTLSVALNDIGKKLSAMSAVL